MRPIPITKVAAGLHVTLVMAAAFYALGINNQPALSEISIRDLLVMTSMALLPVLSATIGLWLARADAAHWVLAAGQTVALLTSAATFGVVLDSVEPMAPLLLLLVSLWLAAGLALLLLVVWIVSRYSRS
jgi:hypothetical protein